VPAFGGASSSAFGFGGASTPAFGAASTGTLSIFGSTPAFGAASSSAFSFAGWGTSAQTLPLISSMICVCATCQHQTGLACRHISMNCKTFHCKMALSHPLDIYTVSLPVTFVDPIRKRRTIFLYGSPYITQTPCQTTCKPASDTSLQLFITCALCDKELHMSRGEHTSVRSHSQCLWCTCLAERIWRRSLWLTSTADADGTGQVFRYCCCLAQPSWSPDVTQASVNLGSFHSML